MATVNNLRSLLASLSDHTEGETVSVRDLLNAVGRRSYGPILFLLAFIALSPVSYIPGINWLMAAVMLVVALQIAIGRDYPWVPSRLLDASFKREHMLRAIAIARPYAHTVDRLVAPRLTILTEPPIAQLVGALCVVAALIQFPLGLVVFGTILPNIAILLLGLGMTARDGVVILLAFTALAGGSLLLFRVAERILASGLIYGGGSPI